MIGAGKTWSGRTGFEWTQVEKSDRRKSPSSSLVPRAPKISIAGEAVSKATVRKHRAAKSAAFIRDEVLAGVGRALPKKRSLLSAALKKLVTDQVLLRTGAVNIEHPAVAAWLKAKRVKLR